MRRGDGEVEKGGCCGERRDTFEHDFSPVRGGTTLAGQRLAGALRKGSGWGGVCGGTCKDCGSGGAKFCCGWGGWTRMNRGGGRRILYHRYADEQLAQNVRVPCSNVCGREAVVFTPGKLAETFLAEAGQGAAGWIPFYLRGRRAVGGSMGFESIGGRERAAILKAFFPNGLPVAGVHRGKKSPSTAFPFIFNALSNAR